jgi:hypothetical protein
MVTARDGWRRRRARDRDSESVLSVAGPGQVRGSGRGPGSRGSLGHQARWGEDVSLRLVMLHLIHEYARHNGHADFLREGIDGVVGA